MDWRAADKGAYIAAVEFQGKEPTLTISAVQLVKVEDEKTQREKDKLVVFFKEIERGWIPCKTTKFCMAGMWGHETDGWIGKRVTLHAQRVKFGRETVDGIRVKGSPSLTAPVKVVVKLPKKKPVTMTMVPTSTGNGKPAAARVAAAPGAAGAPPAPPPAAVPDETPDPDGDVFESEYGAEPTDEAAP